MTQLDKYRLKAQEILSHRKLGIGHGDVDYYGLLDSIALALAESARGAMKRAAEIAESEMWDEQVTTLANLQARITEAIRKEIP